MSNKTKPFEDRSYTIFAVDFDGVICENDWPWIGDPLENNIEQIKWLKKFGNKIILWTNREGERLDQAVKYCLEYGIEFDAINNNLPEVIAYYGCNPRKITADYYIDDKALLVDEYTNEHGTSRYDDAWIRMCARPKYSKSIERRIADGEVDPAYFFEGGSR